MKTHLPEFPHLTVETFRGAPDRLVLQHEDLQPGFMNVSRAEAKALRRLLKTALKFTKKT